MRRLTERFVGRVEEWRERMSLWLIGGTFHFSRRRDNLYIGLAIPISRFWLLRTY